MKKIFITLLCMIIFSSVAKAEELGALQAARTQLFCALSSFSVYGGDENFFALTTLNAQGWKINAITTARNRDEVKAYLMSREVGGELVKVLVIAGTEDIKEVEDNFRVGRVPLHEDKPEEKIFVHRGFRDFTDKNIGKEVLEFVLDDMKKNPDGVLYLTGHSWGGAVALMAAVRLVDMGADAAKIKVVTFGAPVLGNQELADTYQDKIDVTRVVIGNDLLKDSLKNLGYVNFGKVVSYSPKEKSDNFSHDMPIYLDCAIRNYFDAGGLDAPPVVPDEKRIDAPVYVAPVKVVRKSFEPQDEKYIRDIFAKTLSERIKNLTFAEPQFVEIKKAKDFSYNATEFIEPAKKAGCKFILVQMLSAKVIKESRQRRTRVTLEQVICDANGFPLSMHTAGATTRNLTIIEAAAFAQENLWERDRKLFTQE